MKNPGNSCWLANKEGKHNVQGIESDIRENVYFIDEERRGIVIMRCGVMAGYRLKELDKLISELEGIREVYF